MGPRTPIERAIATYCADWSISRVDQPGIAKVNPEILGNTTAPEFSFRYVDIGSVNQGAIDWSAVRELRFGDSPSRARRVVRGGDTIVCTVRPLEGSHAYAGWREELPTVCSRGFVVVRCAGGLSPGFFKHLPFAEQVARQLVAWQSGTNYPDVSERDIGRLVIPIPSQDEQAAIARILDAVDVALERTRAAVDRAGDLNQALLRELLERGLTPKQSRLQRYPAHWTVRRIDEVAEVGSGVKLGTDVSGFKSVELPYLRVANVQDGHLDLSTIKTVRVRLGEVDRYRLRFGDVLMTEGGDLDKLGRGAIWEGQIEACLHQNHIFRIRADRRMLEPEFFSFVIESDIAKRYFHRVAKRTSNLASINMTQVRAFQFPVPPATAEQREIVAIMKASKGALAGLLAGQSALLQLKKSLLRDLLSGGVDTIKELLSTAGLGTS
jgi:type I restriction enzyme, S subunit